MLPRALLGLTLALLHAGSALRPGGAGPWRLGRTAACAAVDEDEAFKKALGGLPYKNRWLFKPSVLARLGSVVGNGRDFSDLNDKSQMLGGTMVVDRSGVLFAKPESESFAHAEVDEVLEAMRAGNVAPTPATHDEM